jgi:hypothetical protein
MKTKDWEQGYRDAIADSRRFLVTYEKFHKLDKDGFEDYMYEEKAKRMK